MIAKLSNWSARHARAVIAFWALLFVASVPAFFLLPGALKVGGFENDHSQSSQALAVLGRRLGFSATDLYAVFTSPTLHPNDPAFIAQVHQALAQVPSDSDVATIIWHTDNFRQVGRDGHTAYELIVLKPNVNAGPSVVKRVEKLIQPTSLHVLIGGAPKFYADIESASSDDLHRAELLAFPFAALALLFVFRSVIAAFVPIVVGGVGVLVSSLILFGVAHTTDLSIFVLNVTTMIGLGLGVDYSLFVTSRFREELEHRRDRPEPEPLITTAALRATTVTAGRAVFYSGLTVCLGLLALLSFRYLLLRSVGLGGCIVVLSTVSAALTLLPALLSVLGPRIDALQVLPQSRALSIFWDRLARAVMAHPLLFGIPALLLLIAVGLPFLHVRLSSPDAAILPKSLASRQAYDLLNAEFSPGATTPDLVVVEMSGNALEPENLARLYQLSHAIAANPSVQRVDSITTIDPRITLDQYKLLYARPHAIPDAIASATYASTVRGNTVLVEVYSRYSAIAPQSETLVSWIRQLATQSGMTVLVGGVTAAIVDVNASLYRDFPHAMLFIAVSTYIVLFLLLRSAILPLKAILMNSLSIVASYGALVFVFQEGHLHQLLGFSPLHYVESDLPILMFCTLFGLSMDYEVFLLSRVREAYVRTGDNIESVAEGLRRSGRIITSAALIVVLVSASFMAASIVLIKALGLGVALAVTLDATVVRALLVPATMRLLGQWNWWIPAPISSRLRRDLEVPVHRGGEP
ncbi:MAG: MMPL family transporter [Chloroflexi bacterium]|nr:MMPL family transporter [Chloroflexota bacterium]